MKKIYTMAFAISATISAFAQIPTSGMIARYDFTSMTNVYTDGSGNNLMLCEGTTTMTEVRLSENPSRPVGDSAAFFSPSIIEGVDANYLSDCGSTNEFHTASASIAAWINVHQFHPWNVVAGIRYNNTSSPYNSLALNTNNSHQIEMGFSTNLESDISVLSTNTIEDSTWYHVVCTYDASTGTASL